MQLEEIGVVEKEKEFQKIYGGHLANKLRLSQKEKKQLQQQSVVAQDPKITKQQIQSVNKEMTSMMFNLTKSIVVSNDDKYVVFMETPHAPGHKAVNLMSKVLEVV